MTRYVCVHGHFYQPPRENAWLELIELQDSAHPYHDWNQRITAECYAPNGASRILDGEGWIEAIVNNYERISFNFGPTLLSWLEQHSRETYQAILRADQLSLERYQGHGSAIAQAYNHLILPLANRADKETQIIWGLRDFELRFGRPAEGMWLPETAVCLETLELLARHGVRYTILAPRQAHRVRESSDAEWTDVSGGRIDPTRPYRLQLPSGAELALFFYDGPISRAVAFEELLRDGETFARRLLSGFSEQRDGAQLMHIATDGETYGHHHRHGEMALSYALNWLESEGGVELINYGAFLERHPPSAEVEIFEHSSWSCVHGVERWRSDCGCSSGMHPGWNQAWRGPLRAALDWLRDELATRYEQAASGLLRDPWQARDAYIDVVLDRSPESLERFITRQAPRQLQQDERVQLFKLLELQRHAMLMYTSCGWFFDELSGIETVQVMQYAGRALQLARESLQTDLEPQFLERLADAHSNIPELADGRSVYSRMVKPSMVDLQTLAAHYAVRSVFEEWQPEERISSWSVEQQEHRSFTFGRSRLALGRARFASRVTLESGVYSYGVLHLGDHNLSAGVREFGGEQSFNSLVEMLSGAFLSGDFAETVRQLDADFGRSKYSLSSLFRDEQRRAVDAILQSTLEGSVAAYRGVYEQNAALLRYLSELGTPPPRALLMAAEFVINGNLKAALEQDEPDVEQLRSWLDEARLQSVTLDPEALGYALQQAFDRQALRLSQEPEQLTLLEQLRGFVETVSQLPFEVDPRLLQNQVQRLGQQLYPQMRAVKQEPEQAWSHAFAALAEQLRIRLPK